MFFKKLNFFLLFIFLIQTLCSEEITLTIGSKSFDLEIAKDHEVRSKGLSYRENINEKGGMIFIFEKPERLQFYMYECVVPIDLIYIDERGVITDLFAMKVEPDSVSKENLPLYCSQDKVKYAIELRGGMIQELSLRKGEQIYPDTFFSN